MSMTASSSQVRTLVGLVACVMSVSTSYACGGRVNTADDEDETAEEEAARHVRGGDACAVEGDLGIDGCNDCTCSDGTWLCNLIHCGAESDEPRPCGELIGRDCAGDEYCYFSSGDCGGGVERQPGLCVPRPTGCDGNYEPFCGCDMRTYSNTCEAHKKGVDVYVALPEDCSKLQ